MAKVYNQIGSLSELLAKCKANGVVFTSLEEIVELIGNYKHSLDVSNKAAKEQLDTEIEGLRSELNQALTEQKGKEIDIRTLLDKQIQDLTSLIIYENYKVVNPLASIFHKLKIFLHSQKLEQLKSSYEKNKGEYMKPFDTKVNKAQQKLYEKENNFDKYLSELENKNSAKLKFTYSLLMENNAFIYGAKGEYMAVEELKKLPDSYSVINNVRFKFHKGIPDRKNDDWIYSVQVDHVVVGPTGLFIIETKHWNERSASNENLFSPVKQINRTGHALFVYLNSAARRGELEGFKSQWGVEKISFRKIILLTSYKPETEYEFVKLLKLFEVRNYITYGKVVFNEEQVKNLVQFFLADHYE